MTLLTAGALTDHRLPATASNACTTDARLGGVERKKDRKREKMGIQYKKKEDNSLIDVENVETTGERCRHLS